MPFVPVPNTVQVEAVYTLDTQIVENTLYYERTTPIGESDVAMLLIDVRDVLQTHLLPLLNTGIQLIRLVGTLLDAVDALSVVMAVNPPISGGQATAGLTNSISYAVQFKTAQRGRSFRGRNYIAGMPSTALATPNTIASSFRASLIAAYQQITQAGADQGWQHVVVSRFSGVDAQGKPIPRATGVTTPVNAIDTADLFVDNQRRRLLGRGQ